MKFFAAAFIKLIFALILLSFIFSCGGSSGTQNTISDFAVSIDEQNFLRIIAEWKTQLPASSKVEYRESGSEENWISTRSFYEKVTEHEVVIVGLKASTTYVVRPVSDGIVGAELKISTNGLSQSLPQTRLAANEDGATVGTVIGGFPSPISTIIGVNKEGKIIWYHTDSEGGDLGNVIVSPMDGRLLYNTYKKIKAVDYLGNEEVLLDIYSLGEVCHHDFLVTPEHNFIYLTYKTVNVDNQDLCVDEIVERDANGNELWRWSAAGHYAELGGLSVDEYISGCGYDWTHSNSISMNVDSQGNKFILLSMRNLDRIIKIDYPSGNIIWQLGKGLDFTFDGSETEDLQWFLHQHSASYLSDISSVLLFDNGNDRYKTFSENFSRAIMYELDEVNMTAKIKWKYDIGYYAEHAGKVQRITDGTFLITLPTDRTMSYSAFIQMDAAGNRLWQTDFSFSTPLGTNLLLGNLNISSLYDLYKRE